MYGTTIQLQSVCKLCCTAMRKTLQETGLGSLTRENPRRVFGKVKPVARTKNINRAEKVYYMKCFRENSTAGQLKIVCL